MKLLLGRMFFCAGCVVCLVVGMSCRPSPSAAADSVQPALLSESQSTTQPALTAPTALELAAVASARSGDFSQSDQLLSRAEKLTGTPEVRQMEMWVSDYEAQRQSFDHARHDQFLTAVKNAHLLISHKMDGYAIDEVSKAYLLTDDRDAFRQEPWVDGLIKETAASADQNENAALWLKAMRMYQDLTVIEPASAVWKNKLKVVATRVGMLYIYTPERFRKLQELEAKDWDSAEDLIRASTRPSVAKGAATQPDVASGAGAATEPSDDDAQMATDWHDRMRGIQFDMLYSALALADEEYYRDVTFQTLLEGGLNGLETVVTTDGLEDAFPGLKDRDQRKIFLDDIEDWKAKAELATPDTGSDIVAKALMDLRDVNQKTVQIPEEVFVSEFAEGAFAKLDLFTNVIWPYDLQDLEKTTEGEFGGVGIRIEPDDSNNIVVVMPLPDTPASRAGVKPGDIITRINGKSAKGLSTDGAVKIITGFPGTNVTLTMRSINGTVKDYVLKREMIKVASIEGCTPKSEGQWDYMLDPDQKIGYIRLTSFSKTTAEDLGAAIDELKADQARAIILDLRYNPGGLLDTAKKVVNKFIDHGVIVSTHADRVNGNSTIDNPKTEMDADPRDLQTTLPLVVLVNQYSASASEIVSGALKDWHRALIVGQRTFGKGSVQMLFPLDTKKAYLKLTTSHYYLPSGRCIHREENSTTWGVDPDVNIEMTPAQMVDENVARLRLDVPDDPVVHAGEPTTRPTIDDVLKADPQLSAALLIMRLQLTAEDTSTNQASAAAVMR
jgi:carboxyl-terminal processing protease